MLSVLIPTLNDERRLVGTLVALVPGAAEGVVREVIVADGGSSDDTLAIADGVGATILAGPANAAERLTAAASGAKGPWLLFLDPGTVLEEGWYREVRAVLEGLERQGATAKRAAVFAFGVDDFGTRARVVEKASALRSLLVGMPRAEQGLLIHRRFYEEIGGFRPLPAMAYADIQRRIGARRRFVLRSRALAAPEESSISAARRALRAIGLGLLMLRLPPRLVARFYL